MRFPGCPWVLVLTAAACACNSTHPPLPAADVPTGTVELEDVAPWALAGSTEFEDYHALVRRVLLPENEPEIWMVSRPSFTAERAIALHGPDDCEGAEREITWYLTVSSTDFRVTQDSSGSWPDWSAFARDDFDVVRRTVPVDAAAAAEIAEAWNAVVRRARHPKPVFIFDDEGRRYEGIGRRMDGTSYEFRSGNRYAQSWSPKKGPAADLIALIDLLATAVDARQPAQREAIVAHCAVAARTLRERVEALPW